MCNLLEEIHKVVFYDLDGNIIMQGNNFTAIRVDMNAEVGELPSNNVSFYCNNFNFKKDKKFKEV